MESLRRTGSDYLRVRQRRAVVQPFPVQLVLHLPEAFPAIHLRRRDGTVAGRRMSAAQLRRFSSPPGFRVVGWSGRISALDEALGVDFVLRSG